VTDRKPNEGTHALSQAELPECGTTATGIIETVEVRSYLQHVNSQDTGCVSRASGCAVVASLYVVTLPAPRASSIRRSLFNASAVVPPLLHTIGIAATPAAHG
jgi:hypothetical protein